MAIRTATKKKPDNMRSEDGTITSVSQSSLRLKSLRSVSSRTELVDSINPLLQDKFTEEFINDDVGHPITVLPVGNASKASTTFDQRKNCGICYKPSNTRNVVASYTCPKCYVRYCSVACYQNHKESCTESFYQSRVEQVLELERKDEDATIRTKKLLHRLYHDERMNLNHASTINKVCPLHRNKLIEILQLIEIDEAHGNMGESQLDEFLQRNPAIQKLIDHCIHYQLEEKWVNHKHDEIDTESTVTNRNSLLQDWILEPWICWWTTELVTNNFDEDDGVDFVNGIKQDDRVRDVSMTDKKAKQTIDDRILTIRTWESLRPRKASVMNTVSTRTDHKRSIQLENSISTTTPLEFNLIDLLYCYCSLVRLYCGPRNAVNVFYESVLESIHQTSAVLSNDERYDCLEKVLLDCCKRPLQKRQVRARHFDCDDWTILLQDVAILCSRYRYVARALFELIDVIRGINGRVSKNTSSVPNCKFDNDLSKDTCTFYCKKMLLLYRKKIEYYISWTLAHYEKVHALSFPINEWILHWKIITP
jgi:HIT zinc finger